MCQCLTDTDSHTLTCVRHLTQLRSEVIVIYTRLPLFGTKINYKFIVLIGNELLVIMLLKAHNVMGGRKESWGRLEGLNEVENEENNCLSLAHCTHSPILCLTNLHYTLLLNILQLFRYIETGFEDDDLYNRTATGIYIIAYSAAASNVKLEFVFIR